MSCWGEGRGRMKLGIERVYKVEMQEGRKGSWAVKIWIEKRGWGSVPLPLSFLDIVHF